MSGIQGLSFSTNFSSGPNYPKLHASPAGWVAYASDASLVLSAGGAISTQEIALDASGSIIQVGDIATGLVVNPSSSSFINKINSSGAAVFYNTLDPSGTAHNVYITDVKCDTANNIYICGYQKDNTLTSKNFVMKLTSTGATSWYSTFYKDNTTTNSAVYLSGASISITPNSATPVITVSATVVNSAGGLDMVLLRYPNTGGTPTWSRSITVSGVTTDISKSTGQVTMDTSNNVYAVTSYSPDGVTINGALVKYNSAGTFQWSTNIGMVGFDAASVCIDNTSFIYVLSNAGLINQYNLSTGAGTNQWGPLNSGSAFSRAQYSSAATPWGTTGGPVFSQFVSVTDPINSNIYSGDGFIGGGIPEGTMVSNGASIELPLVVDSTYLYASLSSLGGGIIKAPLNGSGYNNDPSSSYFGASNVNFRGGSYKYYTPSTAWTSYGLTGAVNNPLTQSTGTITVSATLNVPTNTIGTPTYSGVLPLY
jgi:hypothetical protein